MNEKISIPEKYRKTEEQVSKLEKVDQQRRVVLQQLFEETGLTKAQREELNKEADLNDPDNKKILTILENELEALDNEAKDLTTPETEEFTSLKWYELSHALKADSVLKTEQELLEASIDDLKKDAQARERKQKRTHGQYALRRLEQKALEEVEKKRVDLINSSPEAFVGLNLRELKNYKDGLDRGEKIVRTPYVEKIAKEVKSTFQAGGNIILHGHMGTGKTEFARMIAKDLTGKEPAFFSGSKEATITQLTGHLALKKGEMPSIKKLSSETAEHLNKYDQENPDVDKKTREKIHDTIRAYIIEREKRGTETVFDFGPVYEAMRDGKPLIIDEWNMIPHSVLGRLNDLLLKRAGDTVAVQEDGVNPFPVKEGFFVIATGNLNQGTEQYIERQDLDPASLRRFHPIKYDYLPQYYEKKPDDSMDLADNAGSQNEQFHMILAKVMDKDGTIDVPEGSIEKLWRLAMGARVSQDIFAGRQISSKYFSKISGEQTKEPYFLKKINIDLGRINSVIRHWNNGNEERPDLDYYIWTHGIGEAIDEMDKAFLFQLFKNNYNFFEGWEANDEAVLSGDAKELIVTIPEVNNENIRREFYTSREVTEFAFGKAPERTRFEVDALKKKKVNKKEKEDMRAEINKKIEEIDAIIAEIDNMDIYIEEIARLLDELNIE